MNVLETTIAHLSGELGVPVAASVPATRPDAFATVERGGGAVSEYDDRAALTVQVWHRDRLALEALAERACDALLSMPRDVDGVMRVEVQKSYYPEQVGGYWPRYVVACDAYCARGGE